jgi:tryptophan-rich sensory protein
MKLVFSIIICEAVGILGSVFTMPSIPSWYAGLRKPSFSPPNWVFGPVWMTLYALMGVAAYLVFRGGWEKKEVRIALAIFAIQLVLNSLWSFLFFGLRNPLLGLVDIILLWLLILVTIWKFYAINKTAGLLLLPYIAWVSLATALNFAIFRLN